MLCIHGVIAAKGQSEVRVTFHCHKRQLTNLIPENVSMPKEAPTQFAHNEDGCPLLPNINVDKSTVEGLRKLLTDYVEAQWGMSISPLLF